VRLGEHILSEVFLGEGGGRQGGGRIDIHLILIGLGLREVICVHRVLQHVRGVRGYVDVGHLAARGMGLQIVRHRASV
jgi:hypothetical protein